MAICQQTEIMLHIVLHFLVPAAVAGLFYKKQWLRVYLILIATMIVDMDHLLADPIYDPDRCSIGYHPLHSFIAIGFYTIMLFFTPTRIVGLGLVIHMVLDFIDCYI